MSRTTIWTSMSAGTKDTIVGAVKRGLLTMGQYRRTLARTTLPGVAVLGYHGLRADDLPAGSMAFENLHLRASTFDAHCRVIRECCDPITLDDWREAAAGARSASAAPGADYVRRRLPQRVAHRRADSCRSSSPGGGIRLHRLDRESPPAVVRRCGGARRGAGGRTVEGMRLRALACGVRKSRAC